MDKRLLRHYNRELQYMRESAGEFARQFPKIAGRLALDQFSCADPYVERLLEGFAFLAARIHLKLDAEFPRLTQAILETVYPNYLAPTPSMLVAQFQPDPKQASNLAEGLTLPRDTALRSQIGKGERTPCEYRIGLPVKLWPIEIAEAAYHTRDLSSLEIPEPLKTRACIRLRLKTLGGLPFNKLQLDELSVFLRGTDDIPYRLYEQIIAHGTGLVIQPHRSPRPWREILPRESIRQIGFEEKQALLPPGPRSFQGYRYLHEYFAFPNRFLFAELTGLAAGIRTCEAKELDLLILLDQEDLELESRMEKSNFALFCAPAINLFPKRADRIDLSHKYSDFHVVPDRTRPQDFEVYQVTEVTGHGLRSGEEQTFRPFYGTGATAEPADEGGAYYTVTREPRLESEHEARFGRRTSYSGSEVFLALTDARNAPYRSDLRQLSVMTLCTNRDLPLQMALGRAETDFTLETSAPVATVRCVAGPTPPRAAVAEGEMAWRLISHLSLNYLSLIDEDGEKGAAALRDILGLYGNMADSQVSRQIDGLKNVSSRPVVRRVMWEQPLAFLRGLEISLVFDEDAFQGAGVFLLGAVLDRFLARYVSINAFTETVIKTVERGEVMRWPTRMGTRHTM